MSALTEFRSLIAATPGAVTVTFAANPSILAILNFDGQGWGGDGKAQIGLDGITLTYPYPDLPGLAPGDALLVDGSAYTVTSGPHRKGDGLEAIVGLDPA